MHVRRRFSVSFDYDLRFTRHVFAPDNSDLLEAFGPIPSGRPHRCLVYLDDGLTAANPGLAAAVARWFELHEDRGVQLAATPRQVPGGEVIKQDRAVIELVGRSIAEHNVCRHGFVVIVGGGAVLDAVGLAASLAHRGVRQIRLPSTTLAQADAGLGVKNGINAFGHKNFLGTFTPPWAVVNDADFLTTLAPRDRRAGIAEAVKVALIEDAGFLHWLVAHATAIAAGEAAAIEEAVRRCALLHLAHITGGGDPFEHGSSRPLDLGHWSAHRLEILSDHTLNHGEAVAIGLALDLLYARRRRFLDATLVDLILDALATFGFALWHPALDLRDRNGRRRILEGIEQFREHLGGELCLAMPDGPGRRQDIHEYDADLGEACARELKRFARRAARGAMT
jgi:3-dehydroquinate synthase